MLTLMLKDREVKLPTPHDYQEEAIVLTKKAWKEGSLKVLGVSPTGSGKTIAAGFLINEEVTAGRRCLVVADRKKLVRQFARSIEDDFGITCTMEMGGVVGDSSPVVCATPKTMLNRIKDGKFHPEEFSLLVFEEAHLALGECFQKIASHFDKSRILGLTATPRASKQRSLMEFFDVLVEPRTLKDLIEQKYLAPLVIKNIPINIQVNNSTKGGDFTEEDCAYAIQPYLAELAKAVKEHGAGRCSLIYLPLISISKEFTELLNGLGVKAAHVDGEMTEKQQAKIQLDLEKGDIECVCCSMLWTVGINVRPVNMICNLRLTSSWTLFVQICGRGTRTYDPAKHGVKGTKWGLKHECVLLDPLWNCENHSLLQRPSCLLAKDEDEADEIDKEVKRQIEAGGEADIMSAAQTVQEQRMEALKARLEKLAKRKSQSVSAMDFFLGQGNLKAAQYEPLCRWEESHVTPGQRTVLERAGFDLSEVQNRGHASQIIDSIVKRSHEGLASAKHAILARTLGMSDSFHRKREEVMAWLKLNQKGFNPYSQIPD